MVNTRPSRYPDRSTTGKKTLYQVIDEGLFCTVAFIRDGIPFQIPTGFCRVDDDIYIHASAKSAFIKDIVDNMVSYSVTHIDALVLSPTAFDHSFNYRSVIGFSKAEEVVELENKRYFFNMFTDRYIPGRIDDIGAPTDDQVKITKIVKLSLENAATKVREGDVNVKMNEDDSWCGIIPVIKSYGKPEKDGQLSDDVGLPDYIKELAYGSVTA